MPMTASHAKTAPSSKENPQGSRPCGKRPMQLQEATVCTDYHDYAGQNMDAAVGAATWPVGRPGEGHAGGNAEAHEASGKRRD